MNRFDRHELRSVMPVRYCGGRALFVWRGFVGDVVSRGDGPSDGSCGRGVERGARRDRGGLMTSDLQRMHQDEWLSALRSGEFTQITREFGADDSTLRCATGVAFSCAGISTASTARCYEDPLLDWLGVSLSMQQSIARRNNGTWGGPQQSFDEIADWFKAERDAHDGDLSDWKP